MWDLPVGEAAPTNDIEWRENMSVYDISIITPKAGEIDAVREALLQEAVKTYTEPGVERWVVLEATQEGVASLNAEGNLDYELRTTEPILVTIEKYVDEDAYQAHCSSPWCNTASAAVLPRVSEPVRIFHFDRNATAASARKGDI